MKSLKIELIENPYWSHIEAKKKISEIVTKSTLLISQFPLVFLIENGNPNDIKKLKHKGLKVKEVETN